MFKEAYILNPHCQLINLTTQWKSSVDIGTMYRLVVFLSGVSIV